ncbi:uncharacterized protein [Salvelinus sp. IW2-2015]
MRGGSMESISHGSLPEGNSPISQNSATLQQGNGLVVVADANLSILTLHHTGIGGHDSKYWFTVTALDENITADTDDWPQHGIIDLDSPDPSPSLQRKRPDRKSPSQSGHPDPSGLMEENLLPPAGDVQAEKVILGLKETRVSEGRRTGEVIQASQVLQDSPPSTCGGTPRRTGEVIQASQVLQDSPPSACGGTPRRTGLPSG